MSRVLKDGGNTANMRKALEQIASMGEQIDYQLGSSEETVYAFRNERCLAHNISECARAALSAPPRNCDKYNTTRSATRKWAEITGASIYAEGDGNDWRKFFHWLFAPAQEGGAE